MYPSVKNIFLSFTESFEGGTSHGIRIMFLDAYNRVGTAAGIDLDKNASGMSNDFALAEREGIPKAQRLFWRFRSGPRTGQPAGPADVADEWRRIKSQVGNQWWTYYKQFAQVETTDEAIEAEVVAKLEMNEKILKGSRWFANLDDWPADAQLGLMSMSWSGPGLLTNGVLPGFGPACQAMDFKKAAALCRINGPGSLDRRNVADAALFNNAATILDGGKAYEWRKLFVHYPHSVPTP
jgi:hypothetical protein